MKVPEYDSRTVQPDQLPGVREATPQRLLQVSEIGPGEQVRLGQQMQQAGSEFQQAALESANSAAKDQDAKFAEATTAIMYHPTNGFMNQMGKNAVDMRQGTIDTLQKQQQALEDQLPDDTSKAIFRERAQARTQAAVLAIDEHASRQTKEYALQSSQARAGANKDLAVSSYNPMPGADNSMYAQGMQAQQSELEHQADMLGLDAEAKARYVQYGPDGKSGMAASYTGVVSHLVDNNQVKAAQAYFANIQDRLPPEMADHIRSLLNNAGDVDYMYQYTDQLTRDHPTEASQLNQVTQDFKDGKISGEQRKLIEQRVQQMGAEQRQAQSELAASVLGNVADYAERGQGKSILDFAKAYPQQYLVLKQTGHLETAANYFREGGRGASDGDPALFNTLLDMGVNDPRALLAYPVDKMMAQLSTQQFNQVMAARRGINKQDVQQMTTDRMVNDTMRRMSKYISDAGVNLTPKNDRDKQRLDTFMADVRVKLYDAVKQNEGVPIGEKEANDIALASLKDYALEGSGVFGTDYFKTHKRAFEMTPEERAANKVPEIPSRGQNMSQDDRATIVKALQAKGKPTDEATIAAVYNKWKGGNAQPR